MQRRYFPQMDQELSNDAALFDRYGSIIFTYILKQIHSREDAEDLTLEVFMAAMENETINQLKGEEQLAWLKRVTRNKLIDVYRRTQGRVNVDIDIFAETISDNDGPEQVVLQNEDYQQLHQSIQQLSPIHQKLLYLRYAHNLSAPEIGTLLNKRAGAVRQQLTRARTLLRAIYLKHEQ